jgi:hypothetical protein
VGRTLKETTVVLRRRKWLAALVALAAVACSDNTTVERPESDPAQSALDDFGRRVAEYVALHKRASQPLGTADDTKQPAEISARETALAEAISAARPQAKPGDLFTAEAAVVLKKIIADNYRQSAAVRDVRKDAEAELPDFTPVVNQVYPPTHPLGTFPPTLLALLPPLPEELEYRIVTHHLILRDVEANLVVDVLPRAVP